MSKKKGKKSKKSDPKDVVPMKSVFDILLDQYKDPTSLTLAQQKYVVNVLGLNDDSLYDSVSIDFITDCIRYCMKFQIQTKHIESIYRILQNALYKIKNAVDFEEQQFKEYINQQLSSKLPIKSSEGSSEQDSNQNPSKSPAKIDHVTFETVESIKSFIEERIISEYTVYRAALFKNNPSNIQYEKFKDNFEIGDIVKFQNDQYLSQIKQFKDNHLVLQLLDKDDEIEVIVSKDHTKFLQFVSKELAVPDSPDKIDEKKEQKEEDKEEDQDQEQEKEEDGEKEEEKEKQIEIENQNKDEVHDDAENQDQEQMDDIAPNDIAEDVIINNMNDENKKTLIDMIVQEKVEQKLKSMQNELDRYKQEIAKLKANSSSNSKEENA